MTINNPSFETAGTNPGEAQNWTDAQSNAAEDIAIFNTGTSDDEPKEAFERNWSSNHDSIWAYIASYLSAALFEGNNEAEKFEHSWSDNHNAQWTFGSADLTAALFDSGANDAEDFEDPDWGNAEHWTYSDAPGGGTGVCAKPATPNRFDSDTETEEDFEEGWSQSSATVASASSTAQFDGATNNYESYEGTWTLTMTW